VSYFDDFGESKKIPYDDIPINRNERTSRGSGRTGRTMRMNRFSTMIICFMIVLNLVLSVVCIYFIKSTKNRTIYNNVIEIGGGSEVSSAVKSSAFLSTIAVAAGNSGCNSEYDFYNSMDSRGAGVIYKVDRNSTDSESSSYNKGKIYFATCYHVVSGYVNINGKSSVWVMLPTSLKPLPVKVLAYSAHYDLAVLVYETGDIEGALAGSVPVKIFDSVFTSYGEKVFAIGNPLSSGLSITEGLVSQVNTEIKVGTNSFYTRTIQVSAEINPGNSGGGLFNAKGEFLGIVNAKRHSSTSEGQSFTVVGMSYAIPSSIVCGVVDKLIAGNSKPKRVTLGVTFKHDVSLGRGILNYEYDGEWRQIEQYGVVVESVQSGSVAYGKLKAGDRIESIEFYLEGSDEPMRVPMFNKFVFNDYAFRIKENSEIKVYLYDGNETSTTFKSITLGSSITDFD
jgi:S1-C subfamily serine protease